MEEGAFYTRECPVNGSFQPVPYRVQSFEGSVPNKCSTCRFLFEGGCRKVTHRLLRLDYGYCGIPGSKELVPHPKVFRGIPKKCSTCRFLKEDKIYKLVCSKDAEIFGDLRRGLDYCPCPECAGPPLRESQDLLK